MRVIQTGPESPFASQLLASNPLLLDHFRPFLTNCSHHGMRRTSLAKPFPSRGSGAVAADIKRSMLVNSPLRGVYSSDVVS